MTWEDKDELFVTYMNLLERRGYIEEFFSDSDFFDAELDEINE